MQRIASILVAAWLVGHGTSARADAIVEAEQLFRDGRALLKSGKLAAACEAFEASQRLDPTIATLLNLANCRERTHQLASAWSAYLQAASRARGDGRASQFAQIARDHAAALEPRLSYLTINVADDSRVEGLTISRNGLAIDPAVWNRAIPVDGGHYVITGKAPGVEPWSHDVQIGAEGDHASVNVPRFQTARIRQPAPERAPTVRPAIEVGAATVRSTAVATSPRPRWLAIGFTGGALLALGGAVGFEFAARASYDRYQRSADITPALYDEAITRHHIAQGLAVVGIASAAVATYCWLRAPRHASEPTVVPIAAGGAGVMVVGGF